MSKSNQEITKNNNHLYSSRQEELILSGEEYVIEELKNGWKDYVCSTVFGEFQDSFQTKLIKEAIRIMQALSKNLPLQETIDEIAKQGLDAYLFFEAIQNIVFYFSARGAELMKFVCPSFESVPHIKSEIEEVEKRNLNFQSLGKQKE